MNHLSSLTDKKESVLTDCGYKSRTWIILYTVSLCFHLFFFIALVLMQNFTIPRKVIPSIRVSLVPLVTKTKNTSTHKGANPVSRKSHKKRINKNNPQHAKKKPINISRNKTIKKTKTISLLKKKNIKAKKIVVKSKISLKKKTYRPSKVIENARKNIERAVKKKEENENNALDKAFKRLEEKVGKEGNSLFGVSGKAASNSKLENSGDIKAIDLYNMELMYRIQQNWAFNDILAGRNKHLEVRVIIKILKDGNVRDIWFETRSGNRYLDESALRAIKKSIPLPELPKGYSSYDIGLIFTPAGLK